MADTPKPKKTIDAVVTSVRILETVQELEGAGVTEIANELGTTKATVHNHLRTLETQDLAVRTEDGQYDVGLRVLDVAHYAKNRFPISRIVEDEVDKLAAESGELALFFVEEHWKAVTLHVAAGENSIKMPIYVGNREPVHNTAAGKAIVAYKSSDEIDQFLEEEGLTPVTDQTISDREEFRRELETIRDRGVAYNRGEAVHGLVGVGAPVTYHDGSVAGALSIIGPESRIGDDRLEGELTEMIQRSTNIIEINSTSILET